MPREIAPASLAIGSVTSLDRRSSALSSAHGATLSIMSGGAVAATLKRPVAKMKPAMPRTTKIVTMTPVKNFIQVLLGAILVRGPAGWRVARAECGAAQDRLGRVLLQHGTVDEDRPAVARHVAWRRGAGMTEALREREFRVVFQMRRAPLRACRHQASRVGMNPPRDVRGDAPLRAPNAHAGGACSSVRLGAPLKQAGARGGQLEAMAVAPHEDLAAAAQRARVLFLQAVGAPDLVDQVLVRGGSAASRCLLAHVLVAEGIVVRIAHADGLVLPGDLCLPPVGLHRRPAGSQRLRGQRRGRDAPARPLLDRGQARQSVHAVQLRAPAVAFHGLFYPAPFTPPTSRVFRLKGFSAKPQKVR